MNITRHNYEEFFLLYVDNELNIAQRKAVESFLQENPDLRPELIMLQQTVLPADEQITFSNKQYLLKTTSAPNPVNETNYEEYFVLYADDELTNEQKDQVEQFVYRNPQHQAHFELLQQVRLMPDTSIVFPDKYALYRQEEDDKAPVVRIRWWRIAAAAAVLFFVGGMGWYIAINYANINPDVKQGEGLARIDTSQTKQPVVANRENNTPDQTPAIAVNTDKNNKPINQQKAAISVPVKSGKAIDIVSVNKKKEKNNDAPSNILAEPNVQQKEVAVKLEPQDVEKTRTVDQTQRGTIDGAISVSDLAAINIPKAPNSTVYEDPADTEVIYASNTTRKNTMRGFFRKVSRVFDKATNADTDHEKSSIRIASFEFSLK